MRAETQLSELISEMRIDDDGTASLFLEHARTELVIDLDRAPIEIQRAVEVRRKWQHREMASALLRPRAAGMEWSFSARSMASSCKA